MLRRLPIAIVALALALAAPLAARALDGRQARDLVARLNTDLLSHDSATATLERWCADHGLASPARITAERVAGPDKPLTARQRRELGLAADEAVRYRRVRLRCGAHVLSEADNWYRPGKLTPEMNRLLDETDTPFGRAVQPIGFKRRTLSARVLWRPSKRAAAPRVPSELIQHRALLLLPDGTPFSEVVETYTGDVLAERAN